MKKIYLDAITLAAERCGLEPYSFTSEFADILAAEAYDYHDDSDADPAEGLRKWCEDLQAHGCISGMVDAFIYHNASRDFYLRHLDALEEFKMNEEDDLGQPILNEQRLPHPDWMCWMCFEKFCYRVYCEIFEGGDYFAHFDEGGTIANKTDADPADVDHGNNSPKHQTATN